MKDLTKGNIFKNFIFFAIPLIISGLLSKMYNIVDTIIIGKCIGENGLAAVGSTSTTIEIISSVIWGLGTGIAIYIATVFGSKDYKKVTNSIKINLIFISVLSVIISFIMIVFYRQIFHLLHINKEIYDDAYTYFTIYIGGLIFLSFNWCSVYILNAVGNPSYPLKMSVVSCVCNLLGDILLVKVFNLGVFGAAVVSVIVAAIVSVFYFVKFSKEFKLMGCQKQKIYFERKEIFKAWGLGVPCMFQQFLMYFSSVGIQPVINGIGSAAIAGYAVGMKIYSINTKIFQNSSKCLSNYAAQCIGAGKINMIRKGLRISVVQSILITLPTILICLIFPRQIAGLFYKDAFCKSADYTVLFINICIPFIFLQILNNMFHNFFRGVMRVEIIVVSTGLYTLVRIVAAYILAPLFRINGVYYALVISLAFETVFLLVVYFSGKWRKGKMVTEYKIGMTKSAESNCNNK